MTVYIGTVLAGRNGGKPACAMRFRSRCEFYLYCCDSVAMRDNQPRASMSIAELCDTIADLGPGIGSRWHKRIMRREALRIRDFYI